MTSDNMRQDALLDELLQIFFVRVVTPNIALKKLEPDLSFLLKLITGRR